MRRVIVHVDMDAFFAAIEQLDNPGYRGIPVVVGADPKSGKGRGVVCAASYEARIYGIHSAQPISQAFRRCPTAIFARPRFERYEEVSAEVMRILGEFSPLIEQISIDEAFLDCSGTENLFGPPGELGLGIKRRINGATGLTASVGIASNKSVAKIASDLNKPDGLTLCPPGGEKAFLAPLPVGRLWGAGKKTVEQFKRMNMHTIGDVASFPSLQLEKIFGAMGSHLWLLANGIDDRPVCDAWERKSISEEVTFGEDSGDERHIERALYGIADSLSRRTRMLGLEGRTITLKLRLEGFFTHTRSRTLPSPVSDMKTVRSASIELFRDFDRKGKRVRLVGIRLSNLSQDFLQAGKQLDLFAREGSGGEKSSRKGKQDAECVLDELRRRFGEKVTRAALLRPPHDD